VSQILISSCLQIVRYPLWRFVGVYRKTASDWSPVIR